MRQTAVSASCFIFYCHATIFCANFGSFFYGKTIKAHARTIKAHARTIKADARTIKVHGKTIKADARTIKVHSKTIKVGMRSIKVDARTIKVHGKTIKADARTINLGATTFRFSFGRFFSTQTWETIGANVPPLGVSSGKLRINVIRNAEFQSIFQERQTSYCAKRLLYAVTF